MRACTLYMYTQRVNISVLFIHTYRANMEQTLVEKNIGQKISPISSSQTELYPFHILIKLWSRSNGDLVLDMTISMHSTAGTNCVYLPYLWYLQ